MLCMLSQILPTVRAFATLTGIAFHGTSSDGDVDIQQRLEEHLAHCALLSAVAQDAKRFVKTTCSRCPVKDCV